MSTSIYEQVGDWSAERLNQELPALAMAIASEVCYGRPAPAELRDRFSAIRAEVESRRVLRGPALIERNEGESYGDYVARCLAAKS